MSLCKRGNTWWIRFSHNGKRIQRSAGTVDKAAAQRLHDKLKAEIWKVTHLDEKPQKLWIEAAVRWIKESQHKKSLREDRANLKWLDQYFGNMELSKITSEVIEKIADKKAATNVTNATINRILALIRAILRKAEKQWKWLDRAPSITLRKEEERRISWLSYEKAEALIKELPPHLADLTAFSLATGLRRNNVLKLKWKNVDLGREHAVIHADEAKGKKAIPVPLNKNAISIIRKQIGKHTEFIFTYKGNPIKQCNTKAWRKALERAGIKDFRWHDLRHTWASWHVMNGTSLQELQALGGWQSYDMVLRYAHLSSQHLQQAANRLPGVNLVQPALKLVQKVG